MTRNHALLLFSFMTLLVNGKSFASDYIALLQFSNPQGLTQIVFQMDVPNKKECKALNDNHWRGVRTTCPKCKREDVGCLSSLPSSYTGIVSNKPLFLPYLSSQKDRIVYFGMPIDKSIEICQVMAKGYREKLNRPAVCIHPN